MLIASAALTLALSASAAVLPSASAPAAPAAYLSTSRMMGAAPDPLESLVTEGEDLRDSVAAPGAAASALQNGLRAQAVGTRLAAIRDAAMPRDVAAVPYLSGVMLRLDQPAQVRAASALALGRIGDRIAAGALGEALQDPAEEVRYAAALSLGKLPADGVATRLGRTLKNDPSWQVRFAAAIALGRTRKQFVGQDLADALVDDPSWQVRQQAARSLQEIGTPLAVDTLSAALHDVDPSVRAAAGTSLGELTDADGHRAIVEALREEKDPSVRRILTLASRRAISRP